MTPVPGAKGFGQNDRILSLLARVNKGPPATPPIDEGSWGRSQRSSYTLMTSV